MFLSDQLSPFHVTAPLADLLFGKGETRLLNLLLLLYPTGNLLDSLLVDHIDLLRELFVRVKQLKQVFPRRAPLLLHLQALNDEQAYHVEHFFGGLVDRRPESQGLMLDVVEEVFLVSPFPRDVEEKHLVEDDPDRPDVALGAVVLLLEDLRGHVEGAADAGLEELGRVIFHVLGKTEIPNFDNSLIVEDVGRLHVAVDDPILDELLEALEDLLHDVEGLG